MCTSLKLYYTNIPIFRGEEQCNLAELKSYHKRSQYPYSRLTKFGVVFPVLGTY